MRKIANLSLAAAIGLGLLGCGGSPEVGEAVVVPDHVAKAAEPSADPAASDAPPAPEGDAPAAP